MPLALGPVIKLAKFWSSRPRQVSLGTNGDTHSSCNGCLIVVMKPGQILAGSANRSAEETVRVGMRVPPPLDQNDALAGELGAHVIEFLKH